MTLYQFEKYVSNIANVEKIMNGDESEIDEAEQEVYTEQQIVEIAGKEGIRIPTRHSKL